MTPVPWRRKSALAFGSFVMFRAMWPKLLFIPPMPECTVERFGLWKENMLEPVWTFDIRQSSYIGFPPLWRTDFFNVDRRFGVENYWLAVSLNPSCICGLFTFEDTLVIRYPWLAETIDYLPLLRAASAQVVSGCWCIILLRIEADMCRYFYLYNSFLA